MYNTKKRDLDTYHSKFDALIFQNLCLSNTNIGENTMAQQLGIFFKASSLVIASTSPSLRYMTTSLYPFTIRTTGFFHEH